MTGEERAARSVRYLRNTDALSYEPEIEAEFQRVWNDAIDTAARVYEKAFNRGGDATAAAIRKLKVVR